MKRKFFFFFAAILIESAVCCFLTGFQGGRSIRANRSWHITGSYTEAAKYTGQFDFSNAIPLKGCYTTEDILIPGKKGSEDERYVRKAVCAFEDAKEM